MGITILIFIIATVVYIWLDTTEPMDKELKRSVDFIIPKTKYEPRDNYFLQVSRRAEQRAAENWLRKNQVDDVSVKTPDQV